MIRILAVSHAIVLMFGLVAGQAVASEKRSLTDRSVINATISKPVIRGGFVFKTHCAECHGERADGESQASDLYPDVKLNINPESLAYNEEIIRKGGLAIGKSRIMPPWEDKLSQEEIEDVLAYLHIVTTQEHRGEVVFKTNCILCHGINADGKGRAAKLYDPPPANLTRSDKNDAYKTMIITLGGEAMGRSKFMPIWGKQLSEQEIQDVVAYLRTVLVTESAAAN